MLKVVASVTELKNLSAKNGFLAYCAETKTTYLLRYSAVNYLENGTTVINSQVVTNAKWIGKSGNHVYDPTIDSGGKPKSNRSTREIRFINTSISDLMNRISYEGEMVYCAELKTTYQYFHNASTIPVDGSTSIASNNDPSSRWIGVGGMFVFTSIENYITEGGLSAPALNTAGNVSVSEQLKNPILIFYQEFVKGGGYTSTYQLTDIDNGVLSLPFSASQIVTLKPVQVVFPDGKPVYDNLFPRTQSHRITATVDNTGLVTLSNPPYSGYSQNIRIYFFYSLVANETLYSYTPDDIVSDLELSHLNFAQDIKITNGSSLFSPTILDVEAALNDLKQQLNSMVSQGIAMRERFIAANGQVLFTLAHIPLSTVDDFEVEFNGTELVEVDDFTVSGNQVTLNGSWASSIIAGDKIVISYRY